MIRDVLLQCLSGSAGGECPVGKASLEALLTVQVQRGEGVRPRWEGGQ